MSLEDQIVDVTITRQTVFPTRAGFGIPLLLAFHTRTANMLDTFTKPDDMLDAGFETTDSAYKMALAVSSQNPKPKKFCIGRRLHATTQVIKLLPKTLTEGFIYAFHYVDPTGIDTAITYTNGASETAVTIGTALNTAINALGGSSSTVNGSTGEVTITGTTPGVFFDLYKLPARTDLTVQNTSTDANIVDDYNAVKAVDASTWFGVAIDSNAPAEIEALAVVVEADKKIFCCEASDSDIPDNASTTDLASDLKTAAYANTFGIYSQTRLLGYRAAAWLAMGLAAGAQIPGGNSWAFLTLGGQAADTLLSDGDALTVQGKNFTTYTPIGGINQTYQAKTPDGEFIDLIVGSYWLQARIKERVLGILHNAAQSGSKIPYTDAGVAIIVGAVYAQIKEGIKNGFLADLPAPVVTAPKVADVDPAERAARSLPDVNFSAKLAGAINSLTINGTLSV